MLHQIQGVVDQDLQTGAGRVVYFSNDAAETLYQRLKKRDDWEDTFFMDMVIRLYLSR
jgi:hypothetical protein